MAKPEKIIKTSSKAKMVAEKHAMIVRAAREIFLQDGFAEASMDTIAKSARVSVKTIYSHFGNKGALFSEVMVAACTDHLLSEELPSDKALSERFPWFNDSTRRGLMEAGRLYLQHLLSGEQLALYRVVTRDADRFPELGLYYQKSVARGRTGLLAAYLKNLAKANGWGKRNSLQDAALYEALLRTRIYEEALHGLLKIDEKLIDHQVRSSCQRMWKLLAADC